MSTKNLGLAQALYSGTTAPTNTKMLWYDENENITKYYNTTLSSWASIISDSYVYRTILDIDSTTDYNDINIKIPRISGASGFSPNVRITFQYIGDDGSEFLFEAILSSGINNGIKTIIDMMIVGRGQSLEDFILVSEKYSANLVVKTSKLASPYNKLFIKLEAFDPIGELDLQNSIITVADSYDTPIPDTIFTV